MDPPQIQGDIIPIIRYLSLSAQPAAAPKQITIGFESSLPEMTMDFSPELVRQILYNLLKEALDFSSNDQEILVQVDQLFPSHLSLNIRVKDFGHVDLTPYRKLLDLVNGEINITLDHLKRTSFIIELPIFNQSKYLDTPQILSILG